MKTIKEDETSIRKKNLMRTIKRAWGSLFECLLKAIRRLKECDLMKIRREIPISRQKRILRAIENV